MVSFRWLLSRITRTSSASSARERLLSDGAMHASRARRVATAHQSALQSIPVSGSVAEAAEGVTLSEEALPPSEQRRRLIQIAASYEGHYLAAVEFVAERSMTVGTIRPVRSAAGRPEVEREICVDSRGDVSISPSCRRAAPPSALPLGRLALWLAALLTALGVAAYLL